MKGLLLSFASTALLANYTEEVMGRYKAEVPPSKPVYCEEQTSCCEEFVYTGPYVSYGCDFVISADFILWTPRMSNIAFAATNQEVLNASTLDVKTGRILHPDWSLEPGFRLGLGWFFGCEGWRLSAEYTWIRFNDSTAKPKLKGDQQIISSLGSPLIKTETSKGGLKFGFNVIDIELGRTFCIDSCLLIDTHFGLKTQWQDYRFRLKETGESATTRNPAVSKERFKSDTWGVGIRAGVGPRWYWSRCFSIYSEFAATAQWQHFDSKGVVRSHDEATGMRSSLLDVKDTFYLITPVFEAELGLRWENWYCCDRYHFMAKAGWEIQWWGKQNQFISFYTETRDGDLGLQGLTVSFEFDF